MINVIQTATRGNRTYQLANTPLGRVVFYEFGDGEFDYGRGLQIYKGGDDRSTLTQKNEH